MASRNVKSFVRQKGSKNLDTMDDRMDRKMKIKENSPKDRGLDKKRGVAEDDSKKKKKGGGKGYGKIAY